MWNLLNKIGMMMAFKWDSVEIFKEGQSYAWVKEIFTALTPVLYAIMAIVGAAGAIYAIILGVNLARADEQGKRDEAKKRLITVLISVGVTIALVLFFNELFPMILQAFLTPEATV